MKPCKQPKDLLLIFGFNTDAVIANRKSPEFIAPLGADMQDRTPHRIAVFNAVADQILKELLQMRRVNAQPRHFIESHNRIALANSLFEILQSCR